MILHLLMYELNYTMSELKQKKIQDILSKYRRAGEISIGAKKLAKKIIKPGVNIWEAGEKIENFIIENGAYPAFPINISTNNEAAHYSPDILDDRIIPKKSIIKVDLGAHIDGYLVDTAITLNFNPDFDNLSKASEEALDAVISVAKAGTKISELGTLIEKIITQAGYEPIRNLSGHQIKRYVLHAGVTIPNASPSFIDRPQGRLQLGRIYAVEPFASNGKGLIENGNITNIFRFVNPPSKKQKELIPLYNRYKSKVGVLPFSPRHLYGLDTSEDKLGIYMNLRKLLRANIITGYPILIEKDRKAMVSQFEHTLRITNNGCEVLTSET